VATAGSCGWRFWADVMAIAFSRPDWICGENKASDAIAIGTWPPIAVDDQRAAALVRDVRHFDFRVAGDHRHRQMREACPSAIVAETSPHRDGVFSRSARLRQTSCTETTGAP